MLNLSKINEMTNSHDGDIYSDLYKDVYGYRPRDISFETIEDFDKSLKSLSEYNDREIERDIAERNLRWNDFIGRIDSTMKLVVGCDEKSAIKIIAEAEGVTEEELQFYGWEKLEFELGLTYDSIQKYLDGLTSI